MTQAVTQNSSDSTQQVQPITPLPQNIPIVYVWFGKTVPQDYLISLSQLNYPTIFLKNPEIKRQFKRQLLDIEKSDYYRLQYLYDNGGIYSDFDNVIDYSCLMKLLQPYRNKDLLVFMTDQRHTRQKTQQMTTNLIFAPYPKMPILKKMLDSVDETKQKVWMFAGMRFVGQFSQPVQLSMRECVSHTYDWSWYQASNEVLGRKSQAHPIYAKKLLKKKQIILENTNLQNQLKQIRDSKTKIELNLKQLGFQNQQLKNDYKKLEGDLKDKCSSKSMISQNKNQKNDRKSSAPKIVQDQQNSRQQLLTLSKQQKINYEQTINRLQDLNLKLQFQRDMYILQIFGGIIVFLFMLIVAFCIIKTGKKRKQFKKVENNDIQQKQAIIQE